MADRPTGAYYLGRSDARLSHFVKRQRGDRFFGLGEKTGALDRAGRRFRMDCTDAMGYDAEHSDPLYKFWPFYIAKPSCAANAPASAAYGLFYDNPANCAFDLGCTFDNYHGLFSSYEATCGDLEYVVLLGPSVLEVTRRFAWLCGGTALPPLWSLGYSGSTMSYTDAPDAQERMRSFLQLCAAHEVPCSSFQLSSGYTSIGTKRYVFNWNRDKFPDPAAFAAEFAAAGLMLAANIKPCLLTDHPLYGECREAGLFLGESGAAGEGGGSAPPPETSMFWDAVGSHLDFTNPATAAWWRAQVHEKLLDLGIGSTWNDNNEWRVEDESAVCHGFGTPTPLRLVRPVQALLMVRASLEAQRAHAPTLRPWLISRSGMPGTQRYAQTWSGDNYTSWHTLKHNVRMGLGLSLSGFFNTGHDVGGFAGPAPEPELFVRWVQNGVFHPRFTIHSWNTHLDGTPDGTCNEPWMFPDVLPMVRAAIQLRYTLMPYLYQLLRRAATEHEPLLRPLWLDHEHDPKAWEAAAAEEDAGSFLLGEALLVASVVESGQRMRLAYLPDNGGRGWWSWHDGGEWHRGGQTVRLDAPLDRCPLLARGGSLVVLAEPAQSAATAHSRVRTLRAFPFPLSHGSATVALTWVEDDGTTVDDPSGDADGERDRAVISCELHCAPDSLRLCARVTLHGDGRRWRPAFRTIDVCLPRAERRRLVIEHECWTNGERSTDVVFEAR